MNENPITRTALIGRAKELGRRLLMIAVIALLACNVQVFAQEKKTITGNVSSPGGETLPGVNVSIKGTTIGTITDIDGNFTLSAVGEEDVLLISFIGYKPQEVPVVGRSTFNFTLEEEMTDLDEVVVVGYGVQKKALVTGANQNVKGEKIAELNTATAMEALQGVAPGVSISRANGQPGAGTEVTIRGMGTINNFGPLYVVDGVVVGDIDYLNASDIESIDVLKDAASAAIYGSRAANGVVLVTTKKGKSGKTQVTYDAYYGIQNIYKKPALLNAQEYMQIMDESRINDGMAPYDWQAELSNNAWIDSEFDGIGAQLGQDIWTKLEGGWQGTNWLDEIENDNASVQSHALNILGGTEDAIYTLGVSYYDQEGILGGHIVDAGYKRITARLNTEFVVFKNANGDPLVKIGENLTYTNSENRSVAAGDIYYNDLHDALVQNPLMPVYWDKSPDRFGYTPSMGWDTNQRNPVARMYYRSMYDDGKNNKIVGNAYVNITPIKGLTIRSAYGVDLDFGHFRGYDPLYKLGPNFTVQVDEVDQQMYQYSNYTWSNTITYDKSIGDHRFSIVAGNELFENKIDMRMEGQMSDSRYSNFKHAYLDNVDKTSIDAINIEGYDRALGGQRLVSYIGRMQYNYKERYMLSATLRADGSSNFADGNRWGTFPSVSAGWIFSEEGFIKSSDFITFGKLRASWGQNGNQNVDNFIYSRTLKYLSDDGYRLNSDKSKPVPTAVLARIANPDITWETSEQINIGLDTRFLNSRLSLTVDWYQKTTKDWLVRAPIRSTSGASAPYVNGGDVENKGFELMLGWNDNIGEFKYGISVSGAQNKNEITRIANSEGIIHGEPDVLSQGTSYISRCEVGKPIGFFYGYQTAGILQNQADVDAYVGPEGKPYFDGQRPGDVRFVDQNNDGVIDDKDKVMLGDPNPDFELGLQLNAEYKGIYMSTTLTGKFGHQVMKSYRSFADSPRHNYTTEVFGRWNGEGTSNRLPRLTTLPNQNQTYISDIYMQDADHLRINNLTIGYKLDKLLTNVDFISNAKLYMSVQNLYTFTNYDGMDPDVRTDGVDPDNETQTPWASGIDLGLYPQARTVMFGMSVTF